MQSRCNKRRARHCSSLVNAARGLFVLLAIAVVWQPDGLALPSSSEASPGGAAQEPAEEAPGEQGESGSQSSAMSDRIKKYTNEDGAGVGELPADRRERLREKLMQMPPEKRQQVLQQIKERREQRGAGMPGGPPPEGRFPGGPMGMPAPAGSGGFRAEGGPEGFRHKKGVRNFRSSGDAPIKGGKFFGREPLDLTVLNLTDEQKAKIQSMRAANGQKIRQIRADLRQRQDKFKDMLFDPAASPDQIRSIRKEMNKLQTQTGDIMLDDFLGIRKLLSKEQMELLPQVRPEQRPLTRPAKTPRKTGEPELSEKRKNNDT